MVFCEVTILFRKILVVFFKCVLTELYNILFDCNVEDVCGGGDVSKTPASCGGHWSVK